jgi:L,D-peptidoglycan transpeptidase YkuD (ErfK/YbiS/YcfS/YnhG family)
MIIHVKNNNTLIIDDFRFKCCVGKKGLKLNKKEGDGSTPRGLYSLKKLYFRKDRVGNPECKLEKKIIKKNTAWCDDPSNKKYNEEIFNLNKNYRERFYRKDHVYDYLVVITYNEKKIPHKGSAIFLHLTKNYRPTAGCIAIKKKDFEILLKLVDKKTKIKID